MKRMIATVILILIGLSVSAAFAEAEWDFDLPLSVVTNEYAVLVNRDHLLESSDRPGNLINVNLRRSTSAIVELDAVVAAALENLFADAALTTTYEYRAKDENGSWAPATFSDPDGMQLLLKSGYRSYSTQHTMYHNRLARNDGKDDGIVAPPGASEHQTGYACDVLSLEYDKTHQYMNESFYETPEAQWLEENGPVYGFIVRYPEEDEDITLVPYEPWHLRYVGRDIAGYIKRNGITLEEFTDEWEASMAKFLEDGGDIQAQLLLESTVVETGLESTVTQVFGDDGDPEVSLSLW